MKHIKPYNESIRQYLKPKSEEELDIAFKKAISDTFEETLESDECEVDFERFDDYWDKYTNQYHLYGDYYIYKNKIMVIRERGSNSTFHFSLELVDGTVEEFKDQTIKDIEVRKSALKKLNM